jgi:hypothetical protein
MNEDPLAESDGRRTLPTTPTPDKVALVEPGGETAGAAQGAC